MDYPGAAGKGFIAWETCQGEKNREIVDPFLFQEILAGNLGVHDWDVTFCGMCHEV